MKAFARLVVPAALALTAACGQKGPPLAPLHLVPAAPTEFSVGRSGADARLRFVLPATNANGPGASVLSRVEIYAITVAPGTPPPANRQLLTSKFLVGTIAVKPPPVEGEEAPANAAPDTRPSPGDRATFVETLTEDKLKPVSLVEKAAASTPPAAAAAPAAPPAPTYAVRIYAIRGLTKGGRSGPPATRVPLPLVDPAAPPAAPAAAVTEKAITLTWTAVPSETPLSYNVYKAGANAPAEPINGEPIGAASIDRPIAAFGTEECFAVRSVMSIGGASIESAPSDPVCVTPRDTFPPAAPKGLAVVAGPGTVNLSWDANTEPDLAGYLVLRGDAPGETLQPLMQAPIAGTSYEDRTAKAGARYVYAVVAVDKATPPNTSPQSARVEETAR